MGDLTLIIGNKNYSSWSLRPWLVLRKAGLAFEEVRIPLYLADSLEQTLRYSPTGKLPVLHHGDIRVWDSLAVIEYVADTFPDAAVWPSDRKARAEARAVSAEMHSGFEHLRQDFPMNCRVHLSDVPYSEAVAEDIARIRAIWRDCRDRFGAGGPFLFGAFSAADAMYAPVVLRFESYGVAVGSVERAYMDAVLGLPELAEWIEAGRLEEEIIERAEERAQWARDHTQAVRSVRDDEK